MTSYGANYHQPPQQPNRVVDEYIHRFQGMPDFVVYQLTPDGQDATPAFTVAMDQLVRELIYDEMNPKLQVDVIAAQLAKWSRYESQCLRIWQLRERQLRRWKAEFLVDLYENPPEGGKKPPEWVAKEKYRREDAYHAWRTEIERAEEAYNCTRNLVRAFHALKDMLSGYAFRQSF